MPPMTRASGDAQSGRMVFAPRARLLKLIGEELISDDVLAITELVKNAYDADARSVLIEFCDVTGPEGVITVSDDGHGMDRDALLDRWMAPAGTLKAGKRGRRTRGGRRVLGEKGVGRFAADKLAKRLELVSRTSRSRKELHASFDWDAFDSRDAKLADIQLRWELRPAEVLKARGTMLRMVGVRARWSERMFRKLCNRLARLRPPFEGADDGFSVVVESDEFPDYSGQVRTEVLERAPYRIDAVFDGSQTVGVEINGGSAREHLWNESAGLSCGPVRLRLFGFDLEASSVARLGSRLDARAWLRQWSGVSLYRDGFRVWPYGEPQDDWLRLDQRRVNNPTVCLSNNQVVGFVEITRDANPALFDQTNREGLVENRACQDLRRLVRFVLQQLESERQRLKHPRGAEAVAVSGAGRHGHAEALDTLAQLESHVGKDADGQKLVGALRTGVARDQQLLDAYAELAALGQSALEFSTVALPLLRRADEACTALEASNGNPDTEDGGEVSELRGALDTLAARLVSLETMDGASNARSRYSDVVAELERFKQAVGVTLKEREIKFLVSTKADRALLVVMRPESLHRLMHIFLANTLAWLHRVDRPRIRLSVKDEGDSCVIDFTDNGPGIAKALADRVFDPGYSGREGGRGMGLTIARDIVRKHKGSVEVKTRSAGVTLRVRFPVRKRRTRR